MKRNSLKKLETLRKQAKGGAVLSPSQSLRLDRIIKATIAELTLNQQVNKYKDLLTNSWNRHTREALITVVNQIEAIGGAVTQAELRAYDAQIAGIMGSPVAEEIRRPVVRLNSGIYQSGAQEVAKDTGVRLSFGLPDTKSLAVIDENVFFWIKNYYPDFAQDKMTARLKEYFTGGLNRQDLLLRFRADFLGEMKKARSYWDLLADHTATKVREIGRVAGYEKAGVEVIRVKARLDDKTTRICRKLHGQVIEVKAVRKQVDRYFKQVQAKNKEGVKRVWPWVTDKQADKIKTQPQVDKLVERGKIGLPPYHARCRTRTVAEFEAQAGDRVLTDKDKANGAASLKTGRRKPGPKPKPKTRADTSAAWAARSISSVKNAKDAAAWIEARHPYLASEFQGMSPEAVVEFLRPALKEMDRLLKEYPRIAEEKFLRYFGTQRGPKWKAYKDRYLGGRQGSLRGLGFKQNTWAHAVPVTKDFGMVGAKLKDFTLDPSIGINPKYWNDITGFKWSLKNSVRTGWHPRGCDNADHVITHEFDHVIDNFMEHKGKTGVKGLQGASIAQMISNFKLRNGMPNGLSQYARENLKEGWAESSAAAKWGSNDKFGKRNPYVKAQKEFLNRIFNSEWEDLT